MDAQLRKHNGAMTIFINGKPFPFTAYKPSETGDDDMFGETVRRSLADVAARGVHVHFVPIYFGWSGPDQYDFSRMDWRVNEVLTADPDGYVLIRIQAAAMAPKWWLEANPDAVLKFGCGREPEPPRPPYQTSPAPSLASDFWEEAGVPALRALAQHVRQQPYADRIAGYLPTSYNSNEWFFRSYDDLQVCDLCPAMQKAFNEYLQGKTGSTRQFTVPDRIARGCADHGYLFHPDPLKSNSPVVEYYRFLSSLCAEAIVKVTNAMREVHAPDRIIVGTFYGYLLELSNFYWLADSGHLALARLLEEDGPDFTCSPLEYFTRNPREAPAGGLCWGVGTSPDSAFLAGKAYFGEDDFFPPVVEGLLGWPGPSDVSEDAELLKRNFAFSLCKGQLQWWYDLCGHWYEGQERLDVVEQCVQIATDALERDREQVSEVAIIMDERAPWFVSLDRELQRAMFWGNFHDTFAGLGAPVDLLLLSDLPKADISRYRAVFLPTCLVLNEAERRRIDRLKAEGRTLVFYQADGLINPDAEEVMSDQNMRSLIGMNVVETRSLFQMRITTGAGHPLLTGCEDIPFGVHTEKAVSFYVDDEDAVTLGYYGGRGAVGLAVKPQEGWTSIYCGVPGLPAQLARNILRDAGGHIYNDADDVVYANRSYCAIFTRSPGRKTICLPTAAGVREVFSDRTVEAKPVKQFSVEAEPYRTYLFELRREKL